jgi:hypothetical protein
MVPLLPGVSIMCRLLVLLLAAMFSSPLFAGERSAGSSHPPGVERNKMKSCTREARAKKLTRKSRRAFMMECLGDNPNATSAPENQDSSKPAFETPKP